MFYDICAIFTPSFKTEPDFTTPAATMSKPVLFITGGNAGLGYETIKALLKTETAYEILLGCRSVAKGDAAIESLKKEVPSTSSTLSTVQADIESDASIDAAYSHIAEKHGRLNILINNAGANFDAQARDKLTIREMYNKTWDTNVAGTTALTHSFVPLLLKAKAQGGDARIMFIASGTSSMANTARFDNKPFAMINASPEAGWPKPLEVNPITAYRSAKAGLNMVMTQWSRVLKNDGIKVFSVSPGFLATGLAGIGPEKLKQVSFCPEDQPEDMLADNCVSDGCHRTCRRSQFRSRRGRRQARRRCWEGHYRQWRSTVVDRCR